MNPAPLPVEAENSAWLITGDGLVHITMNETQWAYLYNLLDRDREWRQEIGITSVADDIDALYDYAQLLEARRRIRARARRRLAMQRVGL